MSEINIPKFVIYRRYFHKFREMSELGIMDKPLCNIALVGIAKDLGIVNPILL